MSPPEEPAGENAAPDPEAGPGNAVPTDPPNWRALLSRYPARDLVRLVQLDKKRAARAFAGFRPVPEAVRYPAVLNRLADEARKDVAFGQLVAAGVVALAQSAAANAAAVAEPAARGADAVSAPPAAADGTNQPPALAAEDDERRNRKIKQHRASLRDKDARIAMLEAAVAQTSRERDAARGEVHAAREGEKRARAEAEQARRDQERTRQKERVRPAAPLPPPAPDSGGGGVPGAGNTGLPTGPSLPTSPPPESGARGVKPNARADTLLEDALSRLLSRGKHEVVATVCREALARPGAAVDGAAPKSGAAGLHALFARALYAAGGRLGEATGAEQDRFACAAYLDAGDAGEAAYCFARALARDPKGGGDKTLLARLLNLARRFGQEEVVRATFFRLRASNPAGFGRLSDLLGGLGAVGTAFLPPASAPRAVGPDEIIALSTGGVTARDIASAVDAGDVAYVVRARSGLARLRAAGSDAALADALIAAVAALSRGAVVPLTEPTQPVVVDASNIARHAPDPFALHAAPRVGYLVQMRDFLLGRRFFPVYLIADANLRFLVDDRAAYLALVERGVVRETPGGVVADAMLINTAREQNAPLVTNDHLSDWDDARVLQRLGFVILPDRVTLTPF